MQSKTFQIPAIQTQDEIDRIVTALRSIPGMNTVQGDKQTQLFSITWDEPANLEEIGHIILGLGYTPAMK